MAEPWRPALQAWLHVHLGVVPIPTLIGFGCPERDAYRLVASGEIAKIAPGVLRSTHWPCGAEQLMMAACLRNDKAVIAGPAAARAWKWRGLPVDDGEVKVLIPHGTAMRMPGTRGPPTRHCWRSITRSGTRVPRNLTGTRIETWRWPPLDGRRCGSPISTSTADCRSALPRSPPCSPAGPAGYDPAGRQSATCPP